MDAVRAGLLRALCFYDAIDYPPTQVELISSMDAGSECRTRPLIEGELAGVDLELRRLIDAKHIVCVRGRITLAGRESLIAEHEAREGLFPRKLRRARWVTRWLARLDGVRFVALCNTTALAHAREEGDLDFFIICKTGNLWQTRAWSTLPFRVLGLRPRSDQIVRDAVCLSFFIDESVLDTTSLQIEDDVYFQHWFLDLLPLYDDGVSADLWSANAHWLPRYPLARRWVLHPEIVLPQPTVRLPMLPGLERGARHLQETAWPASIRELMNRDTRVVVNDHVLKFHVEDGREKFRDLYRQNCTKYGLTA